MLDAQRYLADLTERLSAVFGARLAYVGLQGSYLRGEATEESDIDVMVVIDQLSVSDLDAYRGIIDALGSAEKSCGFICAKEDLACWNPLEICHLLHTTKDYRGSLSQLVPAYTREDVRNFVKLSVNNLYHELCHRYLHADRGKNLAKLPAACKGVFFILQNLHYLETGEFIPTKARLLLCLKGTNREVLELSMRIRADQPYDFDRCFALMLTWCQKTLRALAA